MTIYMRASCTGSLTGVFSGSVAVLPEGTGIGTGSYSNTPFNSEVCTGSLLVSTYVSGNSADQRLHAFLGDQEGAGTWTLVAGQPGAYAHDNTLLIDQRINDTVYKPGSTIYYDPGQAATQIAYTLDPADTAGAGTEYTFIATANANGATQFGITGSSGEIQLLAQCGNGAKNETGKTWFAFKVGVVTQGTRVVCRCDGNSWYLDVSTDKDNDEMETNS